MKKAISIICLMCLAISVSASGNLLQLNKPEIATKNLSHKAGPHKAVASTIEELCGEYICQCMDYTTESTPVITFPMTIEPSENPDEVIIRGIAGLDLGLVGVVDFERSMIFIDNQTLLGTLKGDNGEELYAYFQHSAWVEDGAYGDTDIPLEVFILDKGLLFGYTNDIINISAHNGQMFVKTLCALSYIIAGEVYIDHNTYETLDGKATLLDGWIRPGFGYDPADAPIDVTIQRCVENPNQYRLVNPYEVGYLGINEGSDKDGYIVFEITDPECVLVHVGSPSGFYEKNIWGYGNFYFYNLEGLIYADFIALGMESPNIEEIKYDMQNNGYECSTYTDGVVNVLNCMFGFDLNPMAGGFWQDKDKQPIEMTSTIIMPKGFDSITGVEVDNSIATEYFNLQGIRVENPSNGIFIRRQGNNVQKVYVK